MLVFVGFSCEKSYWALSVCFSILSCVFRNDLDKIGPSSRIPILKGGPIGERTS